MIAGLLDDDDDGKNLLDATRGLAGAFSNLLKAAQEGGGADSEVSCRLWIYGLIYFSLSTVSIECLVISSPFVLFSPEASCCQQLVMLVHLEQHCCSTWANQKSINKLK